MALGGFALGLADGRYLTMRHGDYVPPSFVASSAYIVADLLSSGNVRLVTNASAGRLAQADAAAAPRPGSPQVSDTIDGLLLSPYERSGYNGGSGIPLP